MNQEPNNPKGGIAGRLNMTGWRKHYVAAMTADEEAWPQREPGSNLGRIFIILLLLHGFLIGAVVLYNVISPKAPPTVAAGKQALAKSPVTPLSTAASVAPPKAVAISHTPDRQPAAAPAVSPAPAPEGKPFERAVYEVRSGDNVPGIAAALGIRAEELIRLNNLDNTELYPGRKLSYPKKPAPPVLKAMPVPSVAANTKNSKPETFKAVTPPIENSTPVKLKDTPAQNSADAPPKTPAAKTTVQTADRPPVTKSMTKEEPTSGAPKPKTDSATASTKAAKTPTKPTKSSKSETSAKTAAKTEKSSKESASRRSHIVGPKETLYSIARKYGVKVDTLQKLNGIKDPTALRDGMKLAIPAKG